MTDNLKAVLQEHKKNERAIEEAQSEDSGTIQIGSSKVNLDFESHPNLREDFLQMLEKHGDYIASKAQKELDDYLS